MKDNYLNFGLAIAMIYVLYRSLSLSVFILYVLCTSWALNKKKM